MKEKYRKNGLGKEIMDTLEKIAKSKGYHTLILETGKSLVAAQRLYSQLGFKVIENYGPYKNMAESMCMKKKI